MALPSTSTAASPRATATSDPTWPSAPSRRRQGRLPAPRVPLGEGIRATVLGASQFSVQLSGNTVHISDPTCCRSATCPSSTPDCRPATSTRAVAQAIRNGFVRLDLIEGEHPAAVALPWRGEPVLRQSARSGRRHRQAMPRSLPAGFPLVIALDGDIGALARWHPVRRVDVTSPLVSIDGLQLVELDFIDVGEVIRRRTWCRWSSNRSRFPHTDRDRYGRVSNSLDCHYQRHQHVDHCRHEAPPQVHPRHLDGLARTADQPATTSPTCARSSSASGQNAAVTRPSSSSKARRASPRIGSARSPRAACCRRYDSRSTKSCTSPRAAARPPSGRPGERKSFEWGANSMFLLPRHQYHQFGNTTGLAARATAPLQLFPAAAIGEPGSARRSSPPTRQRERPAAERRPRRAVRRAVAAARPTRKTSSGSAASRSGSAASSPT